MTVVILLCALSLVVGFVRGLVEEPRGAASSR